MAAEPMPTAAPITAVFLVIFGVPLAFLAGLAAGVLLSSLNFALSCL